MKRPRKIRVVWKRLGRAWGYAYKDKNTIVLDPRMDDAALLAIAAHEVAHIVCPFLEEETVTTLGNQVGEVLYRLGFRRVEKGDE